MSAMLATRNRTSRTLCVVVLTGILGAVACTPAALPSPTVAPAKPAATQAPAKAVVQPTAPAAAAPAAKPTAATVAGVPADWEKQWNDLIAAAKKEGKLVVYGPPTAELRKALPEAFKQRFGIEMEYNGMSGGDAASRLDSERAAGVYSADALLSGADSMFRVIAAGGKMANGALGMLAPMRPLLLLPEVLDPSKYVKGKVWFSDPQGQYVLRIANYVNFIGALDTGQVPQTALKSWDDLARPEYKGKIASHDPTISGAGLSVASFVYVVKGEDFLKKMYFGQEVFFSRDHRQLADLLARGSHPIVLGLQEQELDRLKNEGFQAGNLSGVPGYESAGFGLLGLLDKAPHPNAARVFVNWLASREGSQVFQDNNRQPSTRNDVKVGPEFAEVLPKPEVQYMDTYEWSYVLDRRAKVQGELQTLLGRR